jgi:hypothetical protein
LIGRLDSGFAADAAPRNDAERLGATRLVDLRREPRKHQGAAIKHRPRPGLRDYPYRRQRIGLGIHEIAPLLAVAMLAKVTNGRVSLDATREL